ncbi:peptidoglycan-binding domain-containing protein [Devosia sp. RR2S18]|uniref:peptidoglycan-binding domain-containing protein n=1 Tax=Devosia rhizosphaerae TaxID=3049774 RepID=UPI0025407737|nr:peptidoglycan-binding domain-containing protein [Devosia sp. RR2S18]WIJ24975.1 peptidoglycan-binding domain-containing protein [Devosia sp. RR2S18]
MAALAATFFRRVFTPVGASETTGVHLLRNLLTASAITVFLLPGFAVAQDAIPAPEDVNSASYNGGELPEGRSALTVKLQVLLDRAGISPGIIDGYKGGISESALRAFENREGFEVDGLLDQEVWTALGGPDATSISNNTPSWRRTPTS